jgi:uncharacterized Fe-S cluster-containing protein
VGCDIVKFDRMFQLFRGIYSLHIKGSTHTYWQEYGVYFIISLEVLNASISIIRKGETRNGKTLLNCKCY